MCPLPTPPPTALLNHGGLSGSVFVSGRVTKSSVCVPQAVSEEQQPGLKHRRGGKEEKSKGKAKVRMQVTAAGDSSHQWSASSGLSFPCQPQNKCAAPDSEGEDDEELSKGKDREKAKKAEQVCVLLGPRAGGVKSVAVLRGSGAHL